jgi:hypothetical protein
VNRLVDDAASDALAVTAARLVRAAGTFEPDPALKTRIRARLHDRDPSPVQLRIRSWMVAALLVSMLAIAGAVVGRALVRHDDAPASTLRLDVHVDHQEPALAPAPIQVQAPPPPPPTTAAPVVRPSPPHRAPTPRGTKPELATPAPEAILVLQATRALHTAHDPARALALLDDYLARYPHGVLAEESLTLAIEAASARGDKSAAAYARSYLARFPTGRFVAAARGVLARSGD